MRFRHSLFIVFCAIVLAPCSAGQPKPEEDLPRAVISEVKKTTERGMLFAVRLYASKTKDLNLQRQRPRRNPDAPKEIGDDDPLSFSLAGSTLQDVYSGKVYPCLPILPQNPFVGPMEVTAAIRAGGWLQLGVAFPPIPPPPDKDGRKQPYQLVFEIAELKIRTLVSLDPSTLNPL